MESLLQKIQNNWETYQLAVSEKELGINNFSKSLIEVVVCVSGGSDSVALLHLLHRLSALLRLKLHILHFNHQLRPESQQEQDFVESLAKQYKIPFHYKKTKNLHYGQSGLQESARNWRIEQSSLLLESIGGGCIATGHHADDQTETFLLKWLRGSHISNLQGMRWKNTPFIRPLLNCSKLELQVYLKNNNLTWMEDPSNQSKAYLRNRVRKELIPLLKELSRQGLRSRISDMSGQSNLLRDYLDSQYENWRLQCQNDKTESPEVLCLTDLKKADDFLQEEIMHKFVNSKTKLKLSYAKLQKILELIRKGSNNWQLSLSKKWSIIRSSNNLELYSISEK